MSPAKSPDNIGIVKNPVQSFGLPNLPSLMGLSVVEY